MTKTILTFYINNNMSHMTLYRHKKCLIASLKFVTVIESGMIKDDKKVKLFLDRRV